MRGSLPRRTILRETRRPPRGPTPKAWPADAVSVMLVNNLRDGFYWSERHRTVVLSASLDETQMLVKLARSLNLTFGRAPRNPTR